MKKSFFSVKVLVVAGLLLSFGFQSGVVLAQQTTILPTTKENALCEVLVQDFEVGGNDEEFKDNTIDDVLACAIKTGRISFNMIPFFIKYFTNFLLGLSGLVAVLFIVLGGYYYVFGGLTEDKDKGKKTIEHALMGMGVALIAWTAINVILNAVSG